MVRTQVQLTEEQSRKLKAIAAQQKASISELVRRGVDMILESNITSDREEIKRRAIAVLDKDSMHR